MWGVEERQIEDFVHRASQDEELRRELVSHFDTVMIREGFSPRVTRIVTHLVPYLAFHESLGRPCRWWF